MMTALALLAALAAPPATPIAPVTDTYHGVAVTEAYRWLEDGADAKVKAWILAQNAYARTHLDALPKIEAIRARVRHIMAAPTTQHWALSTRGDQTFALRRQPPRQQPFLVVMGDLSTPETGRILLDPVVLDPSGHTHIDWFVPSPDGALVAVSLSKGGTESGDVSIFKVATGARVFEVIPRVNGGTAGGSVAWDIDGGGFYYTRLLLRIQVSSSKKWSRRPTDRVPLGA